MRLMILYQYISELGLITILIVIDCNRLHFLYNHNRNRNHNHGMFCGLFIILQAAGLMYYSVTLLD